VHSAGKEVICSLMLDEMSIRKAIEFDDKLLMLIWELKLPMKIYHQLLQP
jgi:hypothetical protein